MRNTCHADRKKWAPAGYLLLAILGFSGCVSIPSDIEPVQGFELERYLGQWYEIARLDHRFERGLINVTAEYSLREDGRVRVINRGFRPEDNAWEAVEGVAQLVAAPDVGRLKVSFFGPFYGGYNIIALDKDAYRYALVCGPNRSYLWILAREPQLDPDVLKALVTRAGELGFATDELIMVAHDPVDRSPDSGA